MKIRFFARLRDVTGEKEEFIEGYEGETVGDLLTGLSNLYGKSFTEYVYGKEGQIADHIQVLLDGTSVSNLQGLKTRLREGVQIDLVPLVAGG